MQKRIIPLILALCLLLSCAGCGEKSEAAKPTAPVLPGEAAQESFTPAFPLPALTEPAQPEQSGPSYWGCQPHFQEVPISETVLETCIPIAIAPDGRSFVGYNVIGFVLCDLESGQMKPLQSANDASTENLRAMLTNLKMRGTVAGTPELLQTVADEAQTADWAKLVELTLSTLHNRYCVSDSGVTVQGDVVVLEDSRGHRNFVVDCEQGTLHVVDETLMCSSATEDELLCHEWSDFNLNPYVVCVSKRDGSTRQLDFSFAVPGLEQPHVQGVIGLSDGSIGAVVAGGAPPFRVALGVIRPDGTQESYAMGVGPGNERYYLYSADPDAIVAWPVLMGLENQYLIRRDTGEVGLLYSEPNPLGGVSVQCAPLSECVQNGELPSLPEAYRGEVKHGPPFVIFAAMADGSIMMHSRGGGELLLFRPSTMETWQLPFEEDEPLPYSPAYSTNGYDLWLDASSTNPDVYLRLAE